MSTSNQLNNWLLVKIELYFGKYLRDRYEPKRYLDLFILSVFIFDIQMAKKPKSYSSYVDYVKEEKKENYKKYVEHKKSVQRSAEDIFGEEKLNERRNSKEWKVLLSFMGVS